MKTMQLNITDQYPAKIEISEKLVVNKDNLGDHLFYDKKTCREDILFKYQDRYYILYELTVPSTNVTSDMVAILQCDYEDINGEKKTYEDYESFIKGNIKEDVLERYTMINYFYGADRTLEDLIKTAIIFIRSKETFDVSSLNDSMSYFSDIKGTLNFSNYCPSLFEDGDLCDKIFIKDELEKYNAIKKAIKTKDFEPIYDEFIFEDNEIIIGASISPKGYCEIYYVDNTELDGAEFESEEEAMIEAKTYELEKFDIIYSQANTCWKIKLK